MKKLILFLSLFCLSALSAFPTIITDSEGRKVKLDSKPKRIALIGGLWPMPSLIIALQGSADNIIYIPKATVAALDASFLSKKFPNIKDIPNGNSENIEYILSLKPDLIMCLLSNVLLCESAKKSGIKTINFKINGSKGYGYESDKTLKAWLDIIAPILGEEEKAKKVYEYTNKTIDLIQNRLKNAGIDSKDSKDSKDNADSKPIKAKQTKAMIVHNFSAKELHAGGLFANYLLKTSGATNIFSDLNGVKAINIEEIYKRDPDIIYINNFSQLIPEDVLNGANSSFDYILYKNLKAVKNKAVYKFPLGTYRPFAPSVDLPILLLFLAKNNHPELFADIDLKTQAKNYYKNVFGFDLREEEINSIFIPNRSAGKTK